ncbi:hypothetical protein [Clostridioides sp. ES-S-0190-01]|uniref:hypothetical protein n=1 Tax=Clostridioides sp. ES-S-0190-01 TaxID=2770787 RepID=UPI001D0FFF99
MVSKFLYLSMRSISSPLRAQAEKHIKSDFQVIEWQGVIPHNKLEKSIFTM